MRDRETEYEWAIESRGWGSGVEGPGSNAWTCLLLGLVYMTHCADTCEKQSVRHCESEKTTGRWVSEGEGASPSFTWHFFQVDSPPPPPTPIPFPADATYPFHPPPSLRSEVALVQVCCCRQLCVCDVLPAALQVLLQVLDLLAQLLVVLNQTVTLTRQLIQLSLRGGGSGVRWV